ncbi:hypothetical protein [Paraburkholderia sp. BL10I2N1]|uniref:hypothetical protein n=1 Tax=Paraburkholderia sp. BL10I2N1 TaxID=1938796 RepID=UPI0010604894|nr:hypothetical protein [Paraburkholderia sp. BL10I2N1]
MTGTEVKARYDAIVASLGKEEYKPRTITEADDATAKAVLGALKSGTTFDALAHQCSTNCLFNLFAARLPGVYCPLERSAFEIGQATQIQE